MTSRILAAVFALVVFGAGLGGCASNDRAFDLTETLERYDKRIRWGDFAGAVGFLEPEARPDPARLRFLLERFSHVQVSGYAPLGLLPSEEELVVRQMELRIVNRHTLRERVLEDRQEWRYDEDAERWWLVSGLPEIGRDDD